MLVDRFGRGVDRLRISITLRCNHSCIFCHREGIPFSNPSHELGPEDWGFLARVASSLGIWYAKLTGGEPLVRKDIVEVVEELSRHLSEVSMVTNASLLKGLAGELADAGLKRVNISLHSLKDDVFKAITGGSLRSVLEGVEAALNAGLGIKINYLVLRMNRDEFKEIINYSSDIGADVNVIELIPIGNPIPNYRELHTDLKPIEEWLKGVAVKSWVTEFQGRPAYELPTGIKVYIIKGYGNPTLCSKCTRLRMTPDGRIQTCIYRPDLTVNAREAILSRDVNALVNAFKEAVGLRRPHFMGTANTL